MTVTNSAMAIYTVIPTAITLLSTAIGYYAKKYELRECLWIQISLFITLILFQAVILSSTSSSMPSRGETQDVGFDSNDYNTTQTTVSETHAITTEKNLVLIRRDYSVEITLIELSYLQIILSLCLSFIIHHKKIYSNAPATSIKQQRMKTITEFFGTTFRVGFRSMVPASLSFTFVIFSREVYSIYHYCWKYDKCNEFANSEIHKSAWNVAFILFLFIWIAIFIWLWQGRQRMLGRHRIHNDTKNNIEQYSNNGQMFGFLPCNFRNSRAQSINDTERDLKPNETDWQDWNTNQLLDWVRDKLFQEQSHSNCNTTISPNHYDCYSSSPYNQRDASRQKSKIRVYIDDDAIVGILETIREQGINGSILPYIQVQDLITMRVGYIHAVFLCVKFRNLMDTANINDSSNDTVDEHNKGVGIDLDEWLGKKVGENQLLTGKNLDSNHDIEHNHDNMDFMNNNVSHYDSAKEIMSEKFGMELPQVRQMPDQLPDPIPSMESNEHLPMTQSQFISKPTKPVASAASTASTTLNNKNQSQIKLDQSLLNSLPPNIREIASRNPDLLMTMMQKKVLSEKPRSKQDVEFETVTKDRVVRFSDGDVEEKVGSLKTPEDYDEENNDAHGTSIDESDEMVGLLRRRRNKQS